jgi:hypothetical protein
MEILQLFTEMIALVNNRITSQLLNQHKTILNWREKYILDISKILNDSTNYNNPNKFNNNNESNDSELTLFIIQGTCFILFKF